MKLSFKYLTITPVICIVTGNYWVLKEGKFFPSEHRSAEFLSTAVEKQRWDSVTFFCNAQFFFFFYFFLRMDHFRSHSMNAERNDFHLSLDLLVLDWSQRRKNCCWWVEACIANMAVAHGSSIKQMLLIYYNFLVSKVHPAAPTWPQAYFVNLFIAKVSH